jgi:hypothetical protein
VQNCLKNKAKGKVHFLGPQVIEKRFWTGKDGKHRANTFNCDPRKKKEKLWDITTEVAAQRFLQFLKVINL